MASLRDVAGEEWNSEDLLAQATNPAMRSDVLRLEILYKYGGIYADIDSVALRSFGRRACLKKDANACEERRKQSF